MRRYFLHILQGASLIGITLTIGVIATSTLYALLIVTGIDENASLLAAFITLVGVILLSLLLAPKPFLNLKEEKKTVMLHKPLQRQVIQQVNENKEDQLFEQLVQRLEQFTQSQIEAEEKRNQFLEKATQNIEQFVIGAEQRQRGVEQFAEKVVANVSVQIREQSLVELEMRIEQLTLHLAKLQKPFEQFTTLVSDINDTNRKTQQEVVTTQKQVGDMIAKTVDNMDEAVIATTLVAKGLDDQITHADLLDMTNQVCQVANQVGSVTTSLSHAEHHI